MYNNGYDNNGYNDYNYNNNYNNYNNNTNNYNYNNNQAAYYQQQGYVLRDEITPQSYNMIIGATLLYGFLVNCFMVAFCYDAVASMNPIAFIISYFVMAIVGGLMVHKSDNPVISFIGYNLIVIPMGLCLSLIINTYLSYGYQDTIIAAFLITAVVTIVMMVLGAMFPSFFLSLGKTLFISLLITIVVEIVLFFIGIELNVIDYVVVLIFCGYIGYDWAKANENVKTVDNAIDSASELYVDIVNLFVRLLRILARAQNN